MEKGVKALNKSLPGNIITNGIHMGIISRPHKTINASSRIGDKMKIVDNDWGWREDEKNIVKIVRYFPN